MISEILSFLPFCRIDYNSLQKLADMELDQEWTMVQRDGNQFVVDGHPFYVNGFNTYWLMVFAADQSTRGKITELFQQASAVGLTVCRTWAFNDGQWRALQKSPSVYDEEIFKVLKTHKLRNNKSTLHICLFDCLFDELMDFRL